MIKILCATRGVNADRKREQRQVYMKKKGDRETDERQYNIPSFSEWADSVTVKFCPHTEILEAYLLDLEEIWGLCEPEKTITHQLMSWELA